MIGNDKRSAGTTVKRAPHRMIVVAVVTVVAVCAGGYGVWRVHENRLDEQARADCSQAAKTLKASRATWQKLLKDAKTGAGTIQANQVKDTKTVDALKQAMSAKTPTGSTSCTAGGRNDVEDAATAIRKASGTYDANRKALAKAVKAVEASRLDKTVANASKLLDDTKGKVADDKTRQALDKAIKTRDADAITKAEKAVNDSKVAKEKADAETKARGEQEAAAAQAQQQSAQSYPGASTYSNGAYSGNSWYSYSGGGSASTPSQTTNGGNGGGASPSTGNESNTPQWGGGCEVSESNPSCEWQTSF